jgi:hypothetical protein
MDNIEQQIKKAMKEKEESSFQESYYGATRQPRQRNHDFIKAKKAKKVAKNSRRKNR